MASKTITWLSADRRWKVQGIILDGQPAFRVWHDTTHGIPLHVDGTRRCGPERGAGGWYRAGDRFPASRVEEFVSWDDLEEVRQ